MHIVTYVAWMGAAVSLYGTARYIIGIIKDGTQPRLASWIAWLIANAAMMIMAFTHGARDAALFDALSALGNAGVLVAGAVKRTGQRPSGATDWICLAVAGSCSLLNAAFPRLAMIGTAMAMFANLVATWPTMHHAWHEPHAETWQLFAANTGASLLGVVGVSAGGGMRLTTVAGPLIAMIGNMALTSITLGRRLGREVKTEVAVVTATIAQEVTGIETEVVELGERVGEELKAAATHMATAAEAVAQKPKRRSHELIGSRAGA
ncbi:MAG TPA: hypothetical protein VLF59_01600 [Candidatus Saccharimonadales bacterium]|nr:hypothetical protein [Candidatus Saccharimonadales bacterium]